MIPAHLAITTLVQLLGETYEGDAVPVAVVDGPKDVNATAAGRPRVVFVGAPPAGDAAAVVGEAEPDAMTRDTFAETFTVWVVWSVDEPSLSMTQTRAAATDLWERGERAIREAQGGALGLDADAGPILGAWPGTSWQIFQGKSPAEGNLSAAVVSSVVVRAQRG